MKKKKFSIFSKNKKKKTIKSRINFLIKNIDIKKIVKNPKSKILFLSFGFLVSVLFVFTSTFSENVTSTAWDGVVAKSFAGGNGTEENPYLISNGGEFAYLKEVLEGSQNASYKTKYYKVTANINMGEKSWEAINEEFKGHFDGDGHTIYNIKIDAPYGEGNYGIFAILDGARIQNINFSKISIIAQNQVYTEEAEGEENTGESSEEAEPVPIPAKIGTIASLVKGSTFYNMSIFEVSIDLSNLQQLNENVVGGFYGLSEDNNHFNKIFINTNIEYNKTITVGNLGQSATGVSLDDIIIYQEKSNSVTANTFADTTTTPAHSSNVTKYTVTGNTISLSDDNISALTQTLNGDNDYTWYVENNYFKIQSPPVEGTTIYQPTIPEYSTGTSSQSPAHTTGSSGGTVYINDYQSDYDYYESLNYTEITSTSSLPTYSNKYNSSNLVKVNIIYDGKDINNSSLVGNVSYESGENESKFSYFKYYPVKSGKITIDLIDNPFSKRPSGYGFNGWSCNSSSSSNNVCNNSTLKYDKTYYTRRLEVDYNSLSGFSIGDTLTIYMNAYWAKANVQNITNANNLATALSNLDDAGMKEYTPSGTKIFLNYYTPDGYIYTYTANRELFTKVTSGNAKGLLRCTTNIIGNVSCAKVNGNNTTCSTSSPCYRTAKNNGDNIPANEITGVYYYSATSGGTTRVYAATTSNGITANSTYHPAEWHEMEIGSKIEDVSGFNATTLFYKASGNHNSNTNYYTSDGSVCATSNCGTTSYKLVQTSDSYSNLGSNLSTTTFNTSSYNVTGHMPYCTKSTGSLTNPGAERTECVTSTLNNYYYLVTRDLNILNTTATVAAANVSSSKPYTLTGLNTTGTITGTLNINGNVSADADMTIENIKTSGINSQGDDDADMGANYSSNSILANWKNFKIGRNFGSDNTNLTGYNFYGGGTGNGTAQFKAIFESGRYINGSPASKSRTATVTFNEELVVGSDYDRAKKDDAKLKLTGGIFGAYAYSSTFSSAKYSTTSGYNYMYNITVKSGSLGYNISDDSANSDNTSGIYIGGWSGRGVTGLTQTTVEGGKINTIVGGYGYSTNNTSIAEAVYMKGGNVRMIYGGAGHSTTYGSRLVSVSGGTVKYSVLGGSDSYNSGDNSDGQVNGNTLVYVGGAAQIGDISSTDAKKMNDVESGSVFGAGGGQSGLSAKGTVYNSHVIINGANIEGNVYGGGNYGQTAGKTNDSSVTAVVDILKGSIHDSVFGSSNNEGFNSSGISNANITVNMKGGTVNNSVYGGSNQKGVASGNVTLNIEEGTIKKSVYGGGKGGYANDTDSGTYVSKSVNVNIGTTSKNPTIKGDVYGGSAFGTVNGTSNSSSGTTNVTVNNGLINGNVYGGGQGDATYTPQVKGNVTVLIKNGNISNVFGGNNVSGTPAGTVTVNITGGQIGGAFGGGNNTGVTTTNINLSGNAKVTSMYGGSNSSGSVTTSNVQMTGGTVDSIYGGNNIGGTTKNSNVTVNGGTVNVDIYGGGNKADTTSTNVVLYNAVNKIPEVYGGGKSSSVSDSSNIYLQGVTAAEAYGGSNTSGTVKNANIYIYDGEVDKLFGGNNRGGSTENSNVTGSWGKINEEVFGGGNNAAAGNTEINITGANGTIPYIYGGGNNASATTTNVNLSNITAGNVYGGSNLTGKVDETNIDITSGTYSNVYGGGNKAPSGDTNIEFKGGTANNVFGGGDNAKCANTTTKITGGQIKLNVYGGGNLGEVTNDTIVGIKNAEVNKSAYAGGNGATAVVYGNTNITVEGTSVIGQESNESMVQSSVFGGGNAAPTGKDDENDDTDNNSIATVNIVGGTIYGNVYGGANTSVVNGKTITNIGQKLSSDSLTSGDILIKGTVFGGGEANASGSETYDYKFISVTKAIEVNIDGLDHTNFDINGSIFGSGDASSTSGTSVINISNYGTKENVKKNISIQRTDTLTLKNSHFILSGASDRTNEYSDTLFTLSRIDEMKIANGTNLYLEEKANLLKKFTSLYIDASGNETKAAASIEDGTRDALNVDNRLYIKEGKNLNVTTNEAASSYGEVTGMTFLGMFSYDRNGKPQTGLYDSINDNSDNISNSDLYMFIKGTYVLGLHAANHDIEVDGYYSTFNNEGTTSMQYVEPTPPKATHYMWSIGEVVTEYTVELTASKYSTLGAEELSLLDFSSGNTTFNVLAFDYSELAEGVDVIDYTDIPRVAETTDIADKQIGIVMKSSNYGWMTDGKTYFKSDPDEQVMGTSSYKTENSNVTPTLLFYLYHSKNLKTSGSMGTVSIQLMAVTKVDDLTNTLKRLVITVDLSRAIYPTTDYEGTITAGREYEMFTTTTTNITANSSFSTYYSLYETSETSLYKSGYHRSLVSNIIFPENTKMTLLDLSGTSTDYYTYVVTSTDVTNAQSEYSRYGEVSYDFSKFNVLGSDVSNKYNDALKNSEYYQNGTADEEFIVIVDFADANITSDKLNCTLFIELRDSEEQTIYGVLGIQQSQMHYNIYANNNSSVNITSTISSDEIYSGTKEHLTINTNYVQPTIGSDKIYDTTFFDNQLGLKISVLDSEDKQVTGTALLGLKYILDNVNYYPDVDGVTRIKISEKVANVKSSILLDLTNAKIATGNYKIKVEAFTSTDGLYSNRDNLDVELVNVKFINKKYGLKVTSDDSNTIISKETGKTEADNENAVFIINHSSTLENPKINVIMYRRKYDEIYSTEYEQVDLADYVTNTLNKVSGNEYEVASARITTLNYFLTFKPENITGTYKLEFKLYDSNAYIGSVERYIIIQ